MSVRIAFIVALFAGNAAALHLDYCGRPPGTKPIFPPLQLNYTDDTGTHSTSHLKLTAVSVVIRHGDRTSTGWNLDKGSWTQSSCFPGDKAVWKCSLAHDQAPGHEAGDLLGFTRHGRMAAVDSDEPFPRRLYRKKFDVQVEEQAGNCMMGQLTERGFGQQLSNGEGLRDAYVGPHAIVGGLLPEEVRTDANFSQELLHLRADDEPRTQMSAMALMLGLYNPEKGQQVPVGLPGRLELHTRDKVESVMYPNPVICPRNGEQVKAGRNTPEHKKYVASVVSPLMARISAAIGVPNMTIYELNALSDCTLAHVCHSFDIPAALEALLPEIIQVNTYLMNSQFSYPSVAEFAKTGMGFLLKEMIAHFDSTLKTGLGRFALYSGHDTTLMPLITALNGRDQTSPWCPYAAMAAFEIWTNSTTAEQYIRVLWREKPLDNLPGCPRGQTLCRWADFRSAVLATLVPSDPYSDCAPTSEPDSLSGAAVPITPRERHVQRIKEALLLW